MLTTKCNYLTATAAAAALRPKMASIECDFRIWKLDSIAAAFFIDVSSDVEKRDNVSNDADDDESEDVVVANLAS